MKKEEIEELKRIDYVKGRQAEKNEIAKKILTKHIKKWMKRLENDVLVQLDNDFEDNLLDIIVPLIISKNIETSIIDYTNEILEREIEDFEEWGE